MGCGAGCALSARVVSRGRRRRRALRGVRALAGPLRAARRYIRGGGRGSGRDAQDGRVEEFTLRRQRAPLALAAGLAAAAPARWKDLALGAAARALSWNALPPPHESRPGVSHPRFPFRCPSPPGGDAPAFGF